jgi:hypothetical protein
MSTNSRIAVMHGDVCKSIYCHWDGYFSYNGDVLLSYYDSAKANQLVALGDLSSLRPEIGEKHAFSQFELPADEVEAFNALTENWCTFYGRDRGEENVGWKVAHNFFEFMDQCESCGAEYFYVMKDDVWYAGCMYGPNAKTLVPLAEIMVTESVEA